MIATEPNKPKPIARVLKWLVRAIPICPHCEKAMHRNGQVGLTRYYRCPSCGATAKSRDREG